MKYRIVFVTSGDDAYFEVEYYKWFRWHTVETYHDTLPFKIPLTFPDQESAKKFVDSKETHRIVVCQKNVINTISAGYYSSEIKVNTVNIRFKENDELRQKLAIVQDDCKRLDATIKEWEEKYGKQSN